MLDARRLEVYTALYSADLETISPTHAKVIDKQSFSTQLNQKRIYFFGDGAEKCKDLIKHRNAVFLSQNWPSAKSMGTLAHKAFEIKRFEDVAYFEPFYLKEFIALKPKKLV
jgi:tRNA threonylcarbamoyladenosine biosynthesis protein TsaB